LIEVALALLNAPVVAINDDEEAKVLLKDLAPKNLDRGARKVSL
jgi:hypothetical protein